VEDKLNGAQIRQIDDQLDRFLLAVPKAEEQHEEEIVYRKKREKKELKVDVSINSLLDVLSVILVFLMKSYSTTTVQVKPSKDLQVPFSHSLEPVMDSVALTITRKNIMLNDVPVVTLEDGKMSDTGTSHGGLLIDELFDKLREGVSQQKVILQRRGKTFDGLCSMIVDRHVPFPILAQAMYTAGQAELSKFKFILIKTERS